MAVVRSHSDRAAVVVDSLGMVDQAVAPVEEADLAAVIAALDLAAVIKFEISSNGCVSHNTAMQRKSICLTC